MALTITTFRLPKSVDSAHNPKSRRTSAGGRVEHHRPTVYVRTSVRFTKWGIGGLSSTSQNGAKKSGQYLKRNPFHADRRKPTLGSFLIQWSNTETDHHPPSRTQVDINCSRRCGACERHCPGSFPEALAGVHKWQRANEQS